MTKHFAYNVRRFQQVHFVKLSTVYLKLLLVCCNHSLISRNWKIHRIYAAGPLYVGHRGDTVICWRSWNQRIRRVLWICKKIANKMTTRTNTDKTVFGNMPYEKISYFNSRTYLTSCGLNNVIGLHCRFCKKCPDLYMAL